MDKSWMRVIKWSKAYIDGVNAFMKFVEIHIGQECDVRCPCVGCLNLIIQDQKTIKDHILERGIDPGYTTLFYHGEPSILNNFGDPHTFEGDRIESDLLEENDDEEDDGINDMLFDIGQQYYQADTNNRSEGNNPNTGGVPAYLEALMMGAQTELYPGCKKISKISFIIQLLHLKVYNRMSNKAIDMMLRLMKLSYPDGETLPSSYYEAKKLLRDLGLGYECIQACKYDCALFWKENKDLETYPTCGTSRWKVNDGIGKKIPHKILRYFPLRPRLQRLFMSQKICKKMVWHKEKRIDDDYMRHPADSIAWKDFDREFPIFANDLINVRLALVVDGFNPFGNLSTSYSMWPVILTPLNLPPWDCMKQPFFMLSLLIPGKNSPGKDIDVTGKWYKNDPYILAGQARQVFYINDPKLGDDWRVVQPFQHRHIYDVDEIQDEVMDVDDFSVMEDEVYQENDINHAFEVGLDEIQSLNREDIDPEDIEESLISKLPEFFEEANLEDADEDDIDDTLVDYCDSEEDSEKNSDDDNESDDDG